MVPEEQAAFKGPSIAAEASPFKYCISYPASERFPFADSTPLEYYIQKAEGWCFNKQISGDVAPVLRQGGKNRILVLAGCFNPPHMGHLELLVHIFLRADSSTVTALLFPVRDTPDVIGRDVTLSTAERLSRRERATLFQDEGVPRKAQ
jgi:hypothetical protein